MNNRKKAFTHRDTRIGQKPGAKPTMGKTLEKSSSYKLSSNDSAKESTMIHIFIYAANQQKQLQYP